MSLEVMKMALDALEQLQGGCTDSDDGTVEAITVWCPEVIDALRQAIEQAEQVQPVAWLITDEKINNIQADSIQHLIDRAKHAHMTDIKLRINGIDEWHEADWLKHMARTPPPPRKPLTDEEIETIANDFEEGYVFLYRSFARAIESAHGIGEKE